MKRCTRRSLRRLASGIVLVALAMPGTGAAQENSSSSTRIGEYPVTASRTQAPEARNSPAIAVDPTEPRLLALAHRVDAREFGCGLQLSGSSGRGWVTAAPVKKLPSGADSCYAPEVAFDRKGRLYYLFVGLRAPANTPMGAFLVTSEDRGRTFSAPRRVLGPNGFGVRMAIDPSTGPRGRLHLAWLQAGADPALGALPSTPNPILAAYSDDGGRRFSKPVTLNGAAGQRVVAPALAIGPDRSVHVAYYDLRDDGRDYQGLEGPTWDGKWSLVLSTSTDGGRHFRRPKVVDDGIVPAQRVMLIFTMPAPALVAGRDGQLFVAWPDGRGGDSDILLRRSSDVGRSWARPQRLNDDAATTGRSQDLPRLAVAPSGRLDAIFYDRRNDGENHRNDVYYTFSNDGGRRFAVNLKLNAKSFDSRIGRQYSLTSAHGLVEFGSRLGLLSTDQGLVAAWTDTRNASHPVQQDVFSAVLRFKKAA